MILAALQRYGEVVTFRHLNVSRAVCPFRFTLGHDLEYLL